MRLAIVLGSSADALAEFHAAADFLIAGGLDVHAVCVNDAIKACPVKPVAFCTIHSVGMPERFIPAGLDMEGVKLFTRKRVHGFRANVVPWKWLGTAGLYGVQIALDELGCAGVILAGVPMDASAGTNYGKENWATEKFVDDMRQGWLKAKPQIGARVRSMSGWTRELLGEPTAEWLASLDTAI